MNRTLSVLLTAIVGVGLLALVPSASAKDGDVRRSGSCSGASDWKLKLSKEDSKIESEFEVDQNVVGDKWKVVLKHDGDTYFRGRRETRAPSGSFEVSRNVTNRAGTDRFLARARNLSTDEVCRGRASF